MKSEKHTKLFEDFEAKKAIHLERLANKMLKNDERNEKLKEKQINKDIFKLFKDE